MDPLDQKLLNEGMISINPKTGERRVTAKGDKFLSDRGEGKVSMLRDPLLWKKLRDPRIWKEGWNDPKVVRAKQWGVKTIRIVFLIAFTGSVAVALWHLFGPQEYHWLSDWQRENIDDSITLFGLCWFLLWLSDKKVPPRKGKRERRNE